MSHFVIPPPKQTQVHQWQFDCVYDHATGEFIIYANGKESYRTKEAETAPEAMAEYFEKWDTDEVKI